MTKQRDRWEEACCRPGGFALTGRLLEYVREAKAPDLGRPLHVLDIGCGSGATLRFLAEEYPSWRCVGVDLQVKAPFEGDGVILQPGRAERLSFPESSFDLVFLECCFSRLEEPESALREIRRVLRPGGKLLMSDLYRRLPDASAEDTAEERPACSALKNSEATAVEGRDEGQDSPRRIGRLETAEQIWKRLHEAGFGVLELQDVSRVLGEWVAQRILEGDGKSLRADLGVDPAELRRVKCGYYLGVCEVSPLWDTLRYARENSPFYRERWKNLRLPAPGEWSAFEDLPFTFPQELAAEPEAFRCVNPKEIARVITLQSSGSTGAPKRLFFTGEDLERTADFFESGIQWLVKPGMKVGVFMEGPSHYSVGGLLKEGLSRIDVETEVFGFISDSKLAARQAADKDTLIGVPSQLFALAQTAPELRPATVLLSADYVPEPVKRYLEQTWQCRVFTHWGMTETGYGGGVQCSAREAYHLRDADLLVEIVDPESGRVLPPGEYGEITVTTLRHRGMPLIRYRTGDLGRMVTGPCPCGCRKPRLDKVLGRIREGIRLSEDQILTIARLDDILYTIPGLRSFGAVWSPEHRRLEITVEPAAGTDGQLVKQEAEKALSHLSGKEESFSVACGTVPVSDGVRKRRILREVPGRFEALISAAGLSSRMGNWKVKMEIRGVPNLIRELNTLFAAGVSTVWILTGHRAKELESLVMEALPERSGQVRLVNNARYAQTQMFDSVRMGVEAARRSWLERGETPEGLFFFPVDVPLFSRYTLEEEMRCLRETTSAVVIPCRGSETGHPLLIRTAALGEIASHDGTMGLRGALDKLGGRQHFLEVPDPGAFLDADTPGEFSLLLAEAQEREAPDEERCRELLMFFGASERLVAHCMAVGNLAGRIAAATGKTEEEIRQIRAAGFLHDIAKGQPKHAEAGAALLASLGYEEVSKLVQTHMEIPAESVSAWDGRAIVYLADKRVLGDREVSIPERFAPGRERFRDKPEALLGLNRRERLAREALAEAVRRGFSEKD